MARPRCYETAAEKQRAYRLRKKNLAEKEARVASWPCETDGGMVKITELLPTVSIEAKSKKNLSGGVESRHAVEAESHPSTCGLSEEDGHSHLITSGSSAPPAQNNLPVPVLAEPSPLERAVSCEARESATEHVVPGDSRGGQNLSRTDQLMTEDHLGGDFVLGASHDRQCLNCNKAYSTRLELNKFCSPKCRGKYIRNLVTMQKKGGD